MYLEEYLERYSEDADWRRLRLATIERHHRPGHSEAGLADR